VEITADFDLNRITQTSDKFDPDGRVVRSSQTREESSSTGDDKAGGPVSVGNELPGAPSSRRPAAQATRIARPRKSSTTKFRGPPRPR